MSDEDNTIRFEQQYIGDQPLPPAVQGFGTPQPRPQTLEEQLPKPEKPPGGCLTKRADPGAPVSAGDRLVVSVGNPGDPVTDGRFTFEWWFVFQPAR